MSGLESTIRARLADSARRYADLLDRSMDPEVVADHRRAAALMREMGEVSKLAELAHALDSADSEMKEARELLESAEDDESRDLARSVIEEKSAERERIFAEAVDALVSREEFGDRNVILEIRAGTGGDEAALFAADLFRMYCRYAERKGFKVDVLSSTTTELGGIKEVVASVSGKDVYRHLRFESGGHRVQRVPETEAQGRIQTSLATVAVMPEADEVEVDIKRDDLKIDFFRASGPGGQKVNKTSSAVRIVHIPTGIKVECQDEKSQHKNRARALKILSSRLMDHYRTQADAERSDLRRSQIGSGDRNERIRTYNFPQNRVTDHRVNLTLYDLVHVMEGDLDSLIEKLEEQDRENKIRDLERGEV